MSADSSVHTELSVIDALSSEIGKKVIVSGWVRELSTTKKCGFIKLSDCWKTSLKSLQCVFDFSKLSDEHYKKITQYSSVKIYGTIVVSPGKQQKIEVHVDDFEIIGTFVGIDTVPFEQMTLAQIRQTRHKEFFSLQKQIIYGIRAEMSSLIEEFFKKEKFTKIDLPIITTAECEGGCDPLAVTSLFRSEITGRPDFSKDFFKCPAFLTVSAQLELETTLTLAKKVFTMTRAVRGELSDTPRHLAEFDMLEIEMAFIKSASDVMVVTERLIKFVIGRIIEDEFCKLGIEYFEKLFKKPIISGLQHYVQHDFVRISHRDAIKMMLDSSHEFTKIPSYSDDLSSEHEKWITSHFGKPVFVTQFPAKIKSFYMPVVGKFTSPDGEEIEYVDCFDLLVPGVGELVGGSARISDYDTIVERIRERGMDPAPLEFYTGIRLLGGTPHGGMGLGFERLVQFAFGGYQDGVGLQARDVRPFPRYYGCPL